MEVSYQSSHKQNLCLQRSVDTVFQMGGIFNFRVPMFQIFSLLLSWNLVIFVWSNIRNAAKNVPLAPCSFENLQWDFFFRIRERNPRYGHSAVPLCLQLYSIQTSVRNSSSYSLNMK